MKKKKIALIFGITGQDGSYLAQLLLKKKYIVHGVKRRSSSLNTGRIDHIYQDPHIKKRTFILHYGDITDSLSVTRLINQIKPNEIYNLAETSKLDHFEVHMEYMNDAVELVLKEIEVNYPNVKVPFHSRWRHFEYGRHNLWSELMERLPKVSKVENARRRFDLAIVSVLLDAGAGPDWRYNDKKTGIVQGRSEGLAIASIRLLESGLLSLHGEDEPFRVDAEALRKLSKERAAI